MQPSSSVSQPEGTRSKRCLGESDDESQCVLKTAPASRRPRAKRRSVASARSRGEGIAHGSADSPDKTVAEDELQINLVEVGEQVHVHFFADSDDSDEAGLTERLLTRKTATPSSAPPDVHGVPKQPVSESRVESPQPPPQPQLLPKAGHSVESDRQSILEHAESVDEPGSPIDAPTPIHSAETQADPMSGCKEPHVRKRRRIQQSNVIKSRSSPKLTRLKAPKKHLTSSKKSSRDVESNLKKASRIAEKERARRAKMLHERRMRIEKEANRILMTSGSQNVRGLVSCATKLKNVSSPKIVKCQVIGPKLWDSWDAKSGTYFRCPRCKDRFLGLPAACKHWKIHCGLAYAGHSKPEADDAEEDPAAAEARALAQSAAIARIRGVGAQLQPSRRRPDPIQQVAQQGDGPVEEDTCLLRFWGDNDPQKDDPARSVKRQITEGLAEQGKTLEDALQDVVPDGVREVQKRDFYAFAASACGAAPDTPGMEPLWRQLRGPSSDGVVAFEEFVYRML